MAATWQNEGADQVCAHIVGKITAIIALTLRLFSNNRAPANTDSNVGAQNVEVTATGYAAIALTGSSWSATGGYPTGGLGQYEYAQQTFTFTGAGAQTVYGYYVTGVVSAVTYYFFGELLGTPYAIPGGGGTLLITPTVQDGQR